MNTFYVTGYTDTENLAVSDSDTMEKCVEEKSI